MYGIVQFTFTPEQLVKEMLSNVVDEIISERNAQRIYGTRIINKWKEKNENMMPPNVGAAPNSKLEFHRIELEELKLKDKYLNNF